MAASRDRPLAVKSLRPDTTSVANWLDSRAMARIWGRIDAILAALASATMPTSVSAADSSEDCCTAARRGSSITEPARIREDPTMVALAERAIILSSRLNSEPTPPRSARSGPLSRSTSPTSTSTLSFSPTILAS